MKPTPIGSLAAGIAAGIVLVAILIAVFAHKDFGSSPSFAGTPIAPPKVVDAFTLTDQNGKPAPLVDPAYAATFVFFGYTHCPDECPIALAMLGSAYRELPDAAAAKTRIVFVTVDPAHDTPPVLAEYVKHFDSHIVGLTGTRAQLAKVWKAYGVDVVPQAKELVGHGGTIYAANAANEVVLVYPPDAKADDVAHDAKVLAR